MDFDSRGSNKTMKKEDYYKPIFAKIGEQYPGPKHEDLEDEEWDDDYYKLVTDFLITKIAEIYMHMDFGNFAKNMLHLEEEIELYIRNHKNDKPNTNKS